MGKRLAIILFCSRLENLHLSTTALQKIRNQELLHGRWMLMLIISIQRTKASNESKARSLRKPETVRFCISHVKIHLLTSKRFILRITNMVGCTLTFQTASIPLAKQACLVINNHKKKLNFAKRISKISNLNLICRVYLKLLCWIETKM